MAKKTTPKKAPAAKKKADPNVVKLKAEKEKTTALRAEIVGLKKENAQFGKTALEFMQTKAQIEKPLKKQVKDLEVEIARFGAGDLSEEKLEQIRLDLLKEMKIGAPKLLDEGVEEVEAEEVDAEEDEEEEEEEEETDLHKNKEGIEEAVEVINFIPAPTIQEKDGTLWNLVINPNGHKGCWDEDMVERNQKLFEEQGIPTAVKLLPEDNYPKESSPQAGQVYLLYKGPTIEVTSTKAVTIKTQ